MLECSLEAIESDVEFVLLLGFEALLIGRGERGLSVERGQEGGEADEGQDLRGAAHWVRSGGGGWLWSTIGYFGRGRKWAWLRLEAVLRLVPVEEGEEPGEGCAEDRSFKGG